MIWNPEARKLNRFCIILALVILVTAIVPIKAGAATKDNAGFWVEFIDVGQGDAALVQCDGHYMLIDGGPAKASSTIYTILSKNKINQLDVMIATHPDGDHIGGLSGALNYATVKTCYSPVVEHDTKPFKNLVKYLDKQSVSVTVPKAGEHFALGSATVEIIGPITAIDDTNNSSIVTKVTYGKTSFLFMGDAETDEENSLIKAKTDLSCNVLKVAHHGSASSTSKAFLTKANPLIAVISVGNDNGYGHPTKEVLNSLSSIKNLSLYRTDLQGDIKCVSDGKSVSVTTEKTADKAKLWEHGDFKPSDDTIIPVLTTGSGASESIDRNKSASTTSAYVLNTNTKKFHYPTCNSVSKMKAKNRQDVNTTRDEIIAMGYDPCGICHP